MPPITRRTSIAALVGTGVIGLSGLHLLGRERGLIDSILRRSVGRYRMEDDQFQAFVADLTRPEDANPARLALYRVLSATHPDTLLRFAPASIGERHAVYERRVVTHFLTRTDFLAVSPGKPVTFNGEAACRSPFANFALA
jgi:hypothetical protein